MLRWSWLALVLCLGGMPSAKAAAPQTIDEIRHVGRLACGTVANADDWDSNSVHGDLSKFDGQICRAVSVALLGDKGHTEIHVYLSEVEALQALQSGEIALAVGVSPSTTTATHFGVSFGAPVFIDSQRILVSKKSGITKFADLKDQVICALDMSAPERTLHDVMSQRHMPFALMTHSEQGEMDAAVAVRRCVAGTAMETRLAQSRANFHAVTSDFVFLPDRLALAPLAIATRSSDHTIGLIGDWTVHALVEAEALGITQQNVAQMVKRDDMRTEQFSGHDFATAQALGLAKDWTVKVIAATGNYAEIFDRTVGRPYALDRGLNALWSQGGLLYAQSFK